MQYGELDGKHCAIHFTSRTLCQQITTFFHPLDNHLCGKFFSNDADFQQALTGFFESKALDFYLQDIVQLKARWKSFWMSLGITFGDERYSKSAVCVFSLINQKRNRLFWLPCFFITLSFSRYHRVTQYADHINGSSESVPKLMTMYRPD